MPLCCTESVAGCLHILAVTVALLYASCPQALVWTQQQASFMPRGGRPGAACAIVLACYGGSGSDAQSGITVLAGRMQQPCNTPSILARTVVFVSRRTTKLFHACMPVLSCSFLSLLLKPAGLIPLPQLRARGDVHCQSHLTRSVL